MFPDIRKHQIPAAVGKHEIQKNQICRFTAQEIRSVQAVIQASYLIPVFREKTG